MDNFSRSLGVTVHRMGLRMIDKLPDDHSVAKSFRSGYKHTNGKNTPSSDVIIRSALAMILIMMTGRGMRVVSQATKFRIFGGQPNGSSVT